MTDDASHPITLRRLEKLNASIRQLLIDNNNYKKRLSNHEGPLLEKVRRLEAENEGLRTLHYAQENVLANIQSKLDKLENKKEADNVQATSSSPPSPVPGGDP